MLITRHYRDCLQSDRDHVSLDEYHVDDEQSSSRETSSTHQGHLLIMKNKTDKLRLLLDENKKSVNRTLVAYV